MILGEILYTNERWSDRSSWHEILFPEFLSKLEKLLPKIYPHVKTSGDWGTLRSNISEKILHRRHEMSANERNALKSFLRVMQRVEGTRAGDDFYEETADGEPASRNAYAGIDRAQASLFAQISRNAYEILMVPADASQADIKRAYYKLAKKHHPDQNPNDKNAEEKFKEANAAYAILYDETIRATYDRWSHSRRR